MVLFIPVYVFYMCFVLFERQQVREWPAPEIRTYSFTASKTQFVHLQGECVLESVFVFEGAIILENLYDIDGRLLHCRTSKG